MRDYLVTGWIEIEITRLVEADWNYKNDFDKHKMEKLVNNIKANGIIENIIVREYAGGDYEVVNGNHRLQACRTIGLKKIMCFNLGQVTLNQAKRIAIETNETRFEADNVKLALMFTDIAADFDDLVDTTFFDDSDVEFFEMVSNPVDNSVFDSGSSSTHKDAIKSLDEFKTIKYRLPSEVAEQFETQLNRFKKILYPDDNLYDISDILPIEAMCQALSQIGSRNILGEL